MHIHRCLHWSLGALALSTFLVACAPEEDSRLAALEQEALIRELNLLQTPVESVDSIGFADTLDLALPMSPWTLPDREVVAVADPLVQAEPEPVERRSPEPVEQVERDRERASPVGNGRWPEEVERESRPPRRTERREDVRVVRDVPQSTSEPRMRLVTHTVAVGSALFVRLSETLSVKGSPVGTTFRATMTQSVVGDDGSILIPAGAVVTGRVIDSTEARRSGSDADLALVFHSIATSGRTIPLAASPQTLPLRRVGGSSRASQAARVGGGAVAGAILGHLIGRDTRSTVAGAAIGVAAGTAVAVGTSSSDVILDAGSALTLRLDRPLEIERAEWR